MARTKKDYDRWGTPRASWVKKPKSTTTKAKGTTKTKKVKRG